MGKLFGTDGIRGKAGKYPMNAEMAMRVGRAVARVFRDDKGRSKIVVGKDTRLSGDMFETAIVSGIRSLAGDVYLTGVFPTPGIAFITSSMNASAGIVISASHNPYFDNGIKVFKGDGFKLSDEKETEIEKLVLEDTAGHVSQDKIKTDRVQHIDKAKEKYIAFLKNAIKTEEPLLKLKAVLDCSNGATHRIAPELFVELGADVESIAVHPNGKNINHHCGSEHPEGLIKKVLDRKADIGLAFDGDGDRLIAVNERGQILSGDHILAICAKAMKQKGVLENNVVVSTVMSNMGLGAALKGMGIRHETSQVGDRYVMQKMMVCGAILGGEDSGHMIFADYHTTGDGILTALKLIEAMQLENKPLSDLSKVMTVYPQVLINVEVQNKPDIETVPEIVDAIQSVESELGTQGRVLVRYSGTQPLCRVMVEGPTEGDTRRYCQQLSDIIKEIIGV
ncbi:MAG: phosphoglucosamine mutase [Desulfobacterales bacterium]